MNATRAKLDEEKHIQRLQPHCFHGEGITDEQLVLVPAQECVPGAVSGTHGRSRNVLAFEDITNGRAPNPN